MRLVLCLILFTMISFSNEGNAQQKYKLLDQWTMGKWRTVDGSTTLILQPTVDYSAEDMYDSNTGSWRLPSEAQYQVTMNGQSYADTYWLHGTTLNLKNYTTFDLVGIDASNLYIQQSFNPENGVIQLKRIGQSPFNLPTTSHQQPTNNSLNHVGNIQLTPSTSVSHSYDKNNQAVLAVSGNYKLTEGDFQKQMALTEFIFAANFDGTDWDNERKSFIEAFQQNPQQTLQGVRDSESTLKQLKTLKKSNDIGYARAGIIGQVLSFKNHPDAAEYQKIIQKYNPVLAYNPTTKMALLERHVEAFFKILEFQGQINDPKFKITTEQRQTAKNELIQKYNTMTMAEQKELASMDIVYTVLAAEWNNMSASEKTKMVQGNTGNATNSGSFEAAKANLQKLLAEQRGTPGGKEMDWNTFNMISNLNTQMHVMNMNIIENMDSGGGYWKVVNY